jgi:hypothetical protein
MSKSVVLDGQTIHGADRFGLWRVLSMEGWDQAPESKTTSEARLLADGDYDGDENYSSRLVTVNGRLSADNPHDAFMARARLTSLLRMPGLFAVDQFDLPQWGTARRGRIAPGAIKGRHLPFQMELRFNDPYKYGEARSFSAAVGSGFDVFQRGTVPANPVVTVTGSFPGGYELTLGGRLVTVPRAVTSGAPHVLDMRTGILRVGGAVVRGGFEYAELFKVQPGLAQNFYSVARTTGTGTVKAAFNDTFV